MSEIIINKSRFIGIQYQVETIAKAKEIIEDLWKEHKKARHICWAVICDEGEKYDDDGEPRGTGGLPIHNVISRNNLNNTLIAVVRYYGGSKLGSSKLLRAYSKSASECIKE